MAKATVTRMGKITTPKQTRDDGVIEVAPVRGGAGALRGLLAADVQATLEDMERAIEEGALASGPPRD